MIRMKERYAKKDEMKDVRRKGTKERKTEARKARKERKEGRNE